MNYAVASLKAEIRVALDQNMTSDQLISSSDIDTLSLEEIIESKIPDAARMVEIEAPHHLLGGGKTFGTSITWYDGEGSGSGSGSGEGYGSGNTKLPDDFLRLVSFQMSDWSYPCTNAITDQDPLYAAQFSRFPGIKGNPQKPVVAISVQPTGTYLEFFSCTQGSGVSVKRAHYIPIPTISDGNIDICPKLSRAIVYRAAHLVAAEIGDANAAAALLQASNNLMV